MRASLQRRGWPVKRLDVLLLALVTMVTVAGMQAVGLILIIAFLITPAAAARFWSECLDEMLFLSALIGGLSGWLGATLSAFFPRMPAGALIVLVAAACFLFSMFFGTARGVLVRYIRQESLKRNVGRQHLLRALYEILEADGGMLSRFDLWSSAKSEVGGPGVTRICVVTSISRIRADL